MLYDDQQLVWLQEQLLKRIETLEGQLAEERKKTEALHSKSSKGDDAEAELHLREREILQQEVRRVLVISIPHTLSFFSWSCVRGE
jgi:hypothetical protein